MNVIKLSKKASKRGGDHTKCRKNTRIRLVYSYLCVGVCVCEGGGGGGCACVCVGGGGGHEFSHTNSQSVCATFSLLPAALPNMSAILLYCGRVQASQLQLCCETICC